MPSRFEGVTSNGHPGLSSGGIFPCMNQNAIISLTNHSARFLVSSKHRARWLRARKSGIGASDAASILGKDPYRSPLETYYRLLDELDEDRKPVMRWGQRIEPLIAQAHAEESGRRIERHGLLLASRRVAFVLATPDYLQWKPRCKRPGILECKNMSAPAAGEWPHWKTRPPEKFWIQAQQQMLVTGLRYATVAVLVGGNDLRTYDFAYDAAFGKKLVRELGRFMKRVELRNPPPADDTYSTADALAQLEERERVVVLSEAAREWLRQIDELEEKRREVEKQLRLSKNLVKADLEHASYGVVPGVIDRVFSFKKVTTPEHSVSEHSERRLLLVKPPTEARPLLKVA